MVLAEQLHAESFTMVPVKDLRLGSSPRRELNFSQVSTLAELDGVWDPILVQRRSLTVVDGCHRVAAAKRLGHRTIRAQYFDGSDSEARVEAVRLNVQHGMPLTLAERNAAARELLALYPMWSDRQLGSICALSPRTIASLRSSADQNCAAHELDEVSTARRVGKDGRRYPVDATEQRRRIREILERDRYASLRSVAARTGASPETVRSVRKSLDAEEQPTVQRPRVSMLPCRLAAEPRHWRVDIACSSTDEGLAFAEWFDRHLVDDTVIAPMTGAVPLSRVYDVIDEARRRAGFWDAFAKELHTRVSRRR
jgi:ParB-like chromosome segregation protein Spo0J